MTDSLALAPERDQRDQARALADQVVGRIGEIILGKDQQIRLALTCLLARGHLLIEDVPGVGKTLLARSIAIALDLDYRRIQFTSDMLPADIIGVSVFNQQQSSFHFHPGPLFAELVLADEVNRATPKAQSALLEGMEEQQVTVDGSTYELPKPFFVIATQNPLNQIGTYPLPESQLDRFLMRIGLGYPDETLERELLVGEDRRILLERLKPAVDKNDVITMQNAAHGVHVSSAILDYVQALVRFTRETSGIELGLSPRGAQDLIHAAKCWAMISGHAGVHPEDVKTVFPAVSNHRLRTDSGALDTMPDLAEFILESVPVP